MTNEMELIAMEMADRKPKYKVVPVEPTDDMCDEMMAYRGEGSACHGHEEFRRDYADMLDAAPDTGMVAVPRELLDRLYHGWNSSSDVFGPMQELRTILEKAND